MRRLYQTEWQKITFTRFHPTSRTNLANADFYDAFYLALFEEYPDYDALDPDWRRNKNEITDWIAALLPDGARVLSVGCGLGYMEQRLWRLHGDRIELHVQDYASHALRWLRQVLPSERIHGAEGESGQFDFIFLSAVDYSLSDADLDALLVKFREALREGGQFVIISASFLEDSVIQRISLNGKEAIKWLLDILRLRQRGQFWGWMRSRQEYQTLMRQAGFSDLTDGFIETPHQRTYWIMSRDEK
jgi:SAM-dependent methyltransferase